MNASLRPVRSILSTVAVAGALTLGLAAAGPSEVSASACQTGGPVGAHNQTAVDAAWYDYQCGQAIWFGLGYNYNNYCTLAASLAHSVGIGTTATGTCSQGGVFNNYAGGYHWMCRRDEFNGIGFDANGYCTFSTNYVNGGSCTSCL